MNRGVLQRFGIRVRLERERAGITQESLADLAGLHRTYLGGVERGERNIGLLNMVRLAKALNLTPAILLEDALLEPEGAAEPEVTDGALPIVDGVLPSDE